MKAPRSQRPGADCRARTDGLNRKPIETWAGAMPLAGLRNRSGTGPHDRGCGDLNRRLPSGHFLRQEAFQQAG